MADKKTEAPKLIVGDYSSTGVNFKNLASVDIPRVKVEKAYEWVRWGSNNLFPEVLIEAINSSPSHNSIILTKRDMVAGKRILIKPDEKVKYSFFGGIFNGGSNRKTQSFIEDCNQYGESLHQVINKIAYDELVFQQSYFQPIFTRGGDLQIEHYPADKIRANKTSTQQVNGYWYSDSWADYRKQEYTPKYMPRFDYADKSKSSLVPIQTYRPGNQYYTLPEYYSAMNYIQLDGAVSRFHLSNIKNGLAPSLMFNFHQGTPTPEIMEKTKKTIEEKLSGEYNAGKILMFFNQDKDSAVTVDVIETSDVDKQYILLNNMLIQNILTASRITSPLLVGIKSAAQLGSSSELLNAYEIFYNQVIQPVQERILKSINSVITMAGMKEVIIESPAPLDFVFTESVLGKIMTINEMRKEINMEPHPDGDVLIDYQKETDIVEEPKKEDDKTDE